MRTPVLSVPPWSAFWVSRHPRFNNLFAPTPSPELYMMKSPQVPVVLGWPWFMHHNPQVDWTLGTTTGWSLSYHASCLLSTSGLQPSSPSVQKIPPDLLAVPPQYHDLGEVLSKARASSLPPHRPYDCAIELRPGTTPPRDACFPSQLLKPRPWRSTLESPWPLTSSALPRCRRVLGSSLWKRKTSHFAPALTTEASTK